jgi:hypothetical protein
MSAREEDLVFVALCDRFRSPTNVRRTMTREELQQATGLDAKVLDETLKALRGPDAHADSYVAFEGAGLCLALCGARCAERSSAIQHHEPGAAGRSRRAAIRVPVAVVKVTDRDRLTDSLLPVARAPRRAARRLLERRAWAC